MRTFVDRLHAGICLLLWAIAVLLVDLLVAPPCWLWRKLRHGNDYKPNDPSVY